MKYPLVIFFRSIEHSYIDKFLQENDKLLNFTPFITNNLDDLTKLWNENYHVLLSFGNIDEYKLNFNKVLSTRMFIRWLHRDNIYDIEALNRSVNYCYINSIIKNIHNTRPIFSIMTTCYNSWNKINRVYESIKKQIFKDWEWVIMDDSPTDDHFNSLKEKFNNDSKIRLYRRSQNSGNIGNVKNECVSLCRGKYVIELDHDDELIASTLSDAVRAFNENEDVGFIYMDFLNLN